MRLLSPTLILLLLLIGVPILEISIFIQLGGWIGLWPTLLTIVGTAVVGTALIRHNWVQVIARAGREADAGRAPVREVFQALCLLVSGLLLLTPGFATDAVGFLLLVPPVQAAIGAALSHRAVAWVQTRGGPGGGPFAGGPFAGGPFAGGAGPGPGRPRPGGGRTGVIDAEFEVVDDDPPADRADPQPESGADPGDPPEIGSEGSRWGRPDG